MRDDSKALDATPRVSRHPALRGVLAWPLARRILGVLVASLTIGACGGNAPSSDERSPEGQRGSDRPSSATTSATSPQPEEPSSSSERTFDCPLTARNASDLVGDVMRADTLTGPAPSSPSEAFDASEVAVIICRYVGSPVDGARTVLQVGWVNDPGRPAFEQGGKVNDHPEWGDDAFAYHDQDGDAPPALASAFMPYPGGGYWHVQVNAPESTGATGASLSPVVEEAANSILKGR